MRVIRSFVERGESFSVSGRNRQTHLFTTVSIGVAIALSMATAVLSSRPNRQAPQAFIPVVDRSAGAVAGRRGAATGEFTPNPDYSPLSAATRNEMRAREQEKWRWKGTSFAVSDAAVGDERMLQQEICALFAAADPEVPDRATAFSCLSSGVVTYTGWTGRIVKVARQGDAWTVACEVKPLLTSRAAANTATPETRLETWHYDGRRLTSLSGQKSGAAVVSFHMD